MRTQKENDRLTSVISAMEQSKYNELKFIYPPGTSPFKAPSEVAEMNEALLESLENDCVLSFTIPKGTCRRNAMNISHHASNTFIPKVAQQAQNAHLASVKTFSSKQVSLASCVSLKFRQQEWPVLGLEDVERQGVDPKAAEYHALEIYRKMIDKVRQKAAVEEKKKDDDLKKKEEVSKKVEDGKPGNLVASVVRKVIKEEQSDSRMGVVETDNKEGFKDIVKAADYFASKGRFWKRSRQRQNPQGQRERKFPQKRNIADQKQEQGNPKGNPKGKRGKSTQSNKTGGKGPKNVVYPARPGGKNTGKGGKNNTGKSGSKGKNNGGKIGGKAKKGQK